MLGSPRPIAKWLLVVAALGVSIVTGGLLFAWSGLYDISASKGHWAVTRAVLAFAMRSSVEQHAEDIETPALDDPAMIALGLGHYEAGCAPCHGAPGEPPNPITQGAVPQPPYLPDHVAAWKPREIFWIVKHGIKYTSMPAWPAPTRDDEVWALVAAVVRFPDMTPAEYRERLRGDTVRDPARIEADARLLAAAGPVGEALVACARCHGLDGLGGGFGAFPRLAGLPQQHLLKALRAYANGTRPSGVMQPIAAELTDDDARLLARHYASMPAPPRPPPPTSGRRPARNPLGVRVATAGDPASRVPPCAPCHGPMAGPDALAPPLAGQYASYLARQLHLWRRGDRRQTPTARIMTVAAAGLSDEQITAVAAYYASLPPADRGAVETP